MFTARKVADDSMYRLLIINNCPSHYRTFMFNILSAKGLERGIDVTVAFQAETERGRPWSADQYGMRFDHFISLGINPWRRKRVRQFGLGTFNTDILCQIAFGGYDWVLMAPFMSVGAWMAARLGAGGACKVLWSRE